MSPLFFFCNSAAVVPCAFLLLLLLECAPPGGAWRISATLCCRNPMYSSLAHVFRPPSLRPASRSHPARGFRDTPCPVMMMISVYYDDPHWALPHGNVCPDPPAHHLYTQTKASQLRRARCVRKRSWHHHQLRLARHVRCVRKRAWTAQAAGLPCPLMALGERLVGLVEVGLTPSHQRLCHTPTTRANAQRRACAQTHACKDTAPLHTAASEHHHDNTHARRRAHTHRPRTMPLGFKPAFPCSKYTSRLTNLMSGPNHLGCHLSGSRTGGPQSSTRTPVPEQRGCSGAPPRGGARMQQHHMSSMAAVADIGFYNTIGSSLQ